MEKPALGDWIWARWRLLVVVVVVVFALNNLAGLLAGSVGLIALANRIAGRALTAKRLVQQARQMVADTDSDDPRE
jgi:hypothetical protein